MKEQSNLFSFIKHSVFILMLLGIVFQSASQTLSELFDVAIENQVSDNEEEQEEEERNEKELKDEQIEPSSVIVSFNQITFTSQKSNFEKNISVLDFILEIQIPPPDFC